MEIIIIVVFVAIVIKITNSMTKMVDPEEREKVEDTLKRASRAVGDAVKTKPQKKRETDLGFLWVFLIDILGFE